MWRRRRPDPAGFLLADQRGGREPRGSLHRPLDQLLVFSLITNPGVQAFLDVSRPGAREAALPVGEGLPFSVDRPGRGAHFCLLCYPDFVYKGAANLERERGGHEDFFLLRRYSMMKRAL